MAGARRIEAHYRLGRKTILCRIVDNLDEALPHLLAEITENTCRKPFTPSEAVHAAEQLFPLAAARRRLDYIPPSLKEARTQGYTAAMQKIAAMVGLSVPTLTKAADIVEAARSNRTNSRPRSQRWTDRQSKPRLRRTLPHPQSGYPLGAPPQNRLRQNPPRPDGRPKLASATNRPLLKALLPTILYQIDNTLAHLTPPSTPSTSSTSSTRSTIRPIRPILSYSPDPRPKVTLEKFTYLPNSAPPHPR